MHSKSLLLLAGLALAGATTANAATPAKAPSAQSHHSKKAAHHAAKPMPKMAVKKTSKPG